MSLPNPDMNFIPLTQGSAEDMNDMVENIEALADGTGLDDGAVGPTKISTPYKFSAYRSTAWVASNGYNKVEFNAEEYDTGGNYDAVTNYRFTAPVNGFYVFSATVGVQMNTADTMLVALYKNGSQVKSGTRVVAGSADTKMIVSPPPMQLVAGDYIEVFVFNANAGAKTGDTGATDTYFGGYLLSVT